MADTILRGISATGGIRIFVAETTELVRRAQEIHKTYPIATAALGRLLTAGAMMGDMMKGENDKLTLRVAGDGPLGKLIVTADSAGRVKGYAENPTVELPSKAPGKLNVGGAVGQGTLSVVCDLGMKEPYSAQLELVSGEIAEDITAYFATSEQVPSACALGVLVDTDGSVINAGGFILQLMPDATDADAVLLEENIKKLSPMTTMLSEGMSPEVILLTVTEGIDMFMYQNETKPAYVCDCTRARVSSALLGMGKEELRALIDEQGQAEVTCQFCDNVYDFSREDLEELYAKLENLKKN